MRGMTDIDGGGGGEYDIFWLGGVGFSKGRFSKGGVLYPFLTMRNDGKRILQEKGANEFAEDNCKSSRKKYKKWKYQNVSKLQNTSVNLLEGKKKSGWKIEITERMLVYAARVFRMSSNSSSSSIFI